MPDPSNFDDYLRGLEFAPDPTMVEFEGAYADLTAQNQRLIDGFSPVPNRGEADIQLGLTITNDIFGPDHLYGRELRDNMLKSLGIPTTCDPLATDIGYKELDELKIRTMLLKRENGSSIPVVVTYDEGLRDIKSVVLKKDRTHLKHRKGDADTVGFTLPNQRSINRRRRLLLRSVLPHDNEAETETIQKREINYRVAVNEALEVISASQEDRAKLLNRERQTRIYLLEERLERRVTSKRIGRLAADAALVTLVAWAGYDLGYDIQNDNLAVETLMAGFFGVLIWKDFLRGRAKAFKVRRQAEMPSFAQLEETPGTLAGQLSQERRLAEEYKAIIRKW